MLPSLKNEIKFIAQIEFDKESQQYYGFIPSLPAVQSYASNLEDLKKNLQEVLELCLEELSQEEIQDAITNYIGTTELTAMA